MGLDMFAKVSNSEIEESVDFDSKEEDVELYYWRKHPNLHGWMEKLYRSKGGKNETFNCDNVKITLEDLDELEAVVREKALPETCGFFFGASCPEDFENDMEFIEKARAAINEGKSVYYTSWW